MKLVKVKTRRIREKTALGKIKYPKRNFILEVDEQEYHTILRLFDEIRKPNKNHERK